MFQVTPQITLIILAIVIIAAIFMAFFLEPSSYEESRIHIFITVLAGLSVLVTLLFYYSVVSLQQQQQNLAVVQETARVSSSLAVDLMGQLTEASNSIPNFVLSLTPLSPCVATIPPDAITPQNCIQKQVLSYKIFDIWQDLIVSSGFVDYDPVAYVTNFLQQAHSIQLLEQWSIMKIDFNIRTQEFGNLLFEYSSKIGEQTPEAYVASANSLIADPRYQAIISD